MVGGNGDPGAGSVRGAIAEQANRLLPQSPEQPVRPAREGPKGAGAAEGWGRRGQEFVGVEVLDGGERALQPDFGHRAAAVVAQVQAAADEDRGQQPAQRALAVEAPALIERELLNPPFCG